MLMLISEASLVAGVVVLAVSGFLAYLAYRWMLKRRSHQRSHLERERLRRDFWGWG